MDIRIGTTLPGPQGQSITIEALLGRGGFGQVFAGRLPDSTVVAIKTVLTAGLNDTELQVLQNEACLSASIAHPNVVRVLHVNDGATIAGVPPYIVMEYVEGGPLSEAIAAHRSAGTQFSAEELRAMFRQIAEGMQAVNACLVHRDLKPGNVLVDSASNALKVSDFGLAKLADASTRPETFKGWGTRPYQAPEAFDGSPNTPAMDIYSAGVMFFEMATLTWPLQPGPADRGPMAWRNAHLLTAPSDLRSFRNDLPPDLIQLVMQMLQKDPTKRPASWGAILARLNSPGPATGAPDVSALVARATTSYVRASETEARERAAREQAEERTALLRQAFNEPLDLLHAVVEAYNSASALAQMEWRTIGPLSVEVRSPSRSKRLIIEGQEVTDLDLRTDGIVRMLALVRLTPTPVPRTREDAHNKNSCGSFNLVYRVRSAGERYGSWSQLRFEISPLIPKSTFPHWFGLELPELPRELDMLSAMGHYQHQLNPLGDDWFKDLLMEML